MALKSLTPLNESGSGQGPMMSRSTLMAIKDFVGWLPVRSDVDGISGNHNSSDQAIRPSGRPVSGVYIETFLFGFLVPLVMLWLSAQGSWASYCLPLLYLAPLVLGLRYGFAAGFAGALLAAIALTVVALLKPDAAFAGLRVQAIGLSLVGMISGQASEIWTARLRQTSALARYHQTRLEQFTSAYHLLKVSHAQLEQRVAGGARNLRNALEALNNRESLRNARSGEPLGGIAEELLNIMVEQGDLYTAAVYALNERSLLKLPALAKAGDAPEISVFNPLLRETLRTGSLTSVQKAGDAGHERVIAVIPLVDSAGHLHGVVVVNDMPFLAVNQETFGLLGVLGKHMGDILTRLIRPINEADSVTSLRDSLQRHLIDARQHGVSSALLACRIADASQRDLLVALCGRSGRGLDQTWVAHDRQGQPVILKLLPLTNEAGAITFANRLQRTEVGGGRFASNGMVNRVWMLDQYRHSDDLLTELCLACDIECLDAVSSSEPVVPVSEAVL